MEKKEEITNGIAVVNSLLASDPKISIHGSDGSAIAVCSDTNIKFKLVELENQTLKTVKDSGHKYGYIKYDNSNLAQFGLYYGTWGGKQAANVVNPDDLTYVGAFKRDPRYNYYSSWSQSLQYTSQFELPKTPESFSVFYGQFYDGGQTFKFPI